MSTPSPAPAPHTLFPQAHWKFERTDDGDVQLLLWLDGDPGAEPVRVPMREAEAWMFVHQADRVLSWAAQSGEGLFSSVPGPDQAAAQMAIHRYTVTSKDTEAHTRMAQATPWANWVEEVYSTSPLTWLVDVFAGDDGQFLQIAMGFGATVEQAPAAEPAG